MNTTTRNILQCRKGHSKKLVQIQSLRGPSKKSHHICKAKAISLGKNTFFSIAAKKYEQLKMSTPLALKNVNLDRIPARRISQVKRKIGLKIKSNHNSNPESGSNLEHESDSDSEEEFDSSLDEEYDINLEDESKNDKPILNDEIEHSEPESDGEFKAKCSVESDQSRDIENSNYNSGEEQSCSEVESDNNAIMMTPNAIHEITVERSTRKSKERGCKIEAAITDEMNDNDDYSIFLVKPKNMAIVLLKKGSSLSLEGTVCIKVISGTVSILGYDLDHESDPMKVFSWKNLGYLRIEGKTSVNIWKNQLLSDQLRHRLQKISSMEMTNEVLQKCENSSVVFTVEKQPSSLRLDLVQYYLPDALKMSSGLVRYPFNDLEFVLRHEDKTSVDMAMYEPLAIEVLRLIHHSKVQRYPGPRLILYGSVNCGKSTLLRFLINKALQKYDKVYYLDADPGQTEFTIAGCVSLIEVTEPVLGYPFTHLKDPVMSIFIGSSSASKSPDMYKKSVLKLVELYTTNYVYYPLFVNTMGWIEGVGALCLTEVIKYIRPTMLIELIPEGVKSTYAYEAPESWDMKFMKFTVPKGIHQTKKFSSALIRNLATLSYFGKCLKLSELLKPLTSIEPYRVSWKKMAVYIFSDHAQPDKFYYSINGSLIALCCVEESLLLESDIPSFPKTVEADPVNECIGFGIVRAIDTSKKALYIITPVDPERLRKVNVLMKGNVNLPVECFQKQEFDSIPHPYMRCIVGPQAFPKLTPKLKKT